LIEKKFAFNIIVTIFRFITKHLPGIIKLQVTVFHLFHFVLNHIKEKGTAQSVPFSLL